MNASEPIQRNMAFLATVPAPKPAPDAVISRIDSCSQAVALAIHFSGLKQAYIAAMLGISPSYLSMIRAGKRPLPDALVMPLCQITGSLVVRQFLDLQAALSVIKGRTQNLLAELVKQMREAA